MNLIHVFQFQDSLAFVPTILETPAAEADALAKSGALPTFSDNQQASNFGNQVDMVCLISDLLITFFFG